MATPGKGQLPPTVSGKNVYDVLSAMQKSIRRGQLDNALYWASDLCLSGHVWWVWRRLAIICSEDVGFAWPEGPAVIHALFQSWTYHKDPIFIADAVIRLCRAPKTRLADHGASLFWDCHRRFDRPIPDEAYDMHTAKGKRMGRALEHFLDEAAKVVPEIHDDDADRLELLVRDLWEPETREVRRQQEPLF